MKLKRNFYKHISIISFTIVVILICSLILPVFTKAESSTECVLQFEEDLDNNQLIVTGNIPFGYQKYELYWANGKMPLEKPGSNASDEERKNFVTEVIKWFEENKVKEKEVVENNSEINSKIDVTQGNQYSVLCLAYLTQDEYLIKWKSRTISMQVVNEDIPTTDENNVPEFNEEISLNLYKVSGKQEIGISAVSKSGEITVLKYLILSKALDVGSDSSENEANRLFIQNFGISVNVEKGKSSNIIISDSKIEDSKFLSVYVESSDGTSTYKYWKDAGKIAALTQCENLPWKDDYEELPDENNNNEDKSEENTNNGISEGTENNGPEVYPDSENKDNENSENVVDESKENKDDNKEHNESSSADGNKESNEENKENNENSADENKEDNKTNEENKNENKEDSKTNEENINENKEEIKNDKEQNKENNNEKDKDQSESQGQGGSVVTNSNNNKEQNVNSNKQENTDKNININVNKQQNENNKYDDYEEIPSENIIESPLPQTGSNNTFIIICIIIFSCIGAFNLKKYIKDNEE